MLPATAVPAETASGIDFFETRIRPLLVDRCYQCHSAGAEKIKGGLYLDSRAGILKGGNSGKPAIVPGEPEKSHLIEGVRYSNPDFQMPPRERLTERQVADLVTWIKMGAPDPRTSGAAAATRPAGAVGKHWAFKLPRKWEVPLTGDQARNLQWVATDVDAFILSKLEEKQIQPSREADRRTLIRRATYDLTGLPPTMAEVEMFASDNSPDAYQKLIDRLLASPRYGERWGRYWLDLARYSDTKGYVYDREERFFVHAHAYRDWVISAFNADVPYDRFLMLQIAADQMVQATDSTAENKDLAAMGFLTVGRRFLGIPHDIIDDRIDVVCRTTQALSVGCARCHDHKFDPIPTADYYSLYGVFAGSLEKAITLGAPNKTKEFEAYQAELRKRTDKLAAAMKAKREQVADRYRRQVAQYLNALLVVETLPKELFYTTIGPDDVNPVIVRQWQAYVFKREKSAGGVDPIFGPWHVLAKISPEKFATDAPAGLKRLMDDKSRPLNPLVRRALSEGPAVASMNDVAGRYGKVLSEVDQHWREAVKKPGTVAMADANEEALRQVLYGPDSPAVVPDGGIDEVEFFFEEPARVELGKLTGEIDRLNISHPGAPDHAVILADKAIQQNPRIFKRGSPTNKGSEVPRQYLELICGESRTPFTQGSGRLEMARLIASRDNPLTARVMVNRIWQHHFGEGLCRTPSDFGTRSELPSHPELLDWLAIRFVEDGWSIKKLHKLIMTSAVYRQTSVEDAASAKAAAMDPENRLLWRMNRQRLDFESMRDSWLSASGELDLTMGGRPVDLYKAPYSNRRTVYGLVDRQYLPGVLRVFDFANPDLHIPQRSGTTVPQQALFFLNHPFVLDRARALSNRAEIQSATDPAERVKRLYRLIYQRDPTTAQIEAGVRFVTAEKAQPAAPVVKVSAEWSYGYGEFDEAAGRVKGFIPLPHFTGDAWQGGAAWPDGKLGWAQLTPGGGHCGDDLKHAVVRRWIAPRDMIIAIGGTIRHEHAEGDGIIARIVSSRNGQVFHAELHNKKANAAVERMDVKKGDTIDFVVSINKTLHSNDFLWSPTIRSIDDPSPAGTVKEWIAKADFGGPATAPPKTLGAWEKYSQVLLVSNEFMFVD